MKTFSVLIREVHTRDRLLVMQAPSWMDVRVNALRLIRNGRYKKLKVVGRMLTVSPASPSKRRKKP